MKYRNISGGPLYFPGMPEWLPDEVRDSSEPLNNVFLEEVKEEPSAEPAQPVVDEHKGE